MPLPFELVATTVTVFLLIASGFQSRLLERPRFGACPSCGRLRRRGVCDVCSRPA